MPSHSNPINMIFSVIATALLVSNIATAAETITPAPADSAIPDSHQSCCCGHAHPGGNTGMELFERMDTELALTDTQKQELGSLLEMYRPRIKELVERGVTSGQAMLDVAPDDPAYNTRAAELSQLAGATTAEMVTLLTELQANAYALLTSAQQAQFLELRAEQRQRMETQRARRQERRERGDWKGGKHFGHGKGGHCLDMQPVAESATVVPGAAD